MPLARTGTPPSNAGFTLLEMMVVIFILGMAATLMVANIDALTPGARLRAAGRHLVGTLQAAQNEAISRSRSCYIVYDLQDNTYWIRAPFEKHEDPDERVDFASQPLLKDRRTPIEWEDLLRAEIPKGIKIQSVSLSADDMRTGGVVQTELSPYGTGAPHVVRFVGENGDVLSVRLYPLTGAVELHDGALQLRAPVSDAIPVEDRQ